nr:murein L,D-transpeptidase catalytic domain family protein [uncultured Mucilaginibacter sp.]
MYKIIYRILPAFLLLLSFRAAAKHLDIKRTREKAKQALQFCKQKGYNTQYCILIDMSLSSGVKRFVVWSFKGDSILASGLVSHGCGRSPWSGTSSRYKPEFSNADGSHCTALGKYQLKGRGYSNWGIHVKYYLNGLESTNNKAMGRQIVFHSWDDVPEQEVYPLGTPEGWGCPAISNNTMKLVDPLLRKQKKNTLLWIYN